MITSRIDWAGAAGPVGQVYIVGWDESDERPVDHGARGQYVILKDDGSPVAIVRDKDGKPKIRIVRVVGLRLSAADCARIAEAQKKYIGE